MSKSHIVDNKVTNNTGKTQVILSNHFMDDVEAAFDNISPNGHRSYYECAPPIDLTHIFESHFKGVAVFNDRIIFSYTNIGGDYGKYLFSCKDVCGDQGIIDLIQDTEPKGWAHPGGEQVCGSFMVVGIQEGAKEMTASAIQIYDVRNAEINYPIELIKTIPQKQAINGCAMTKELGEDGKYIIAAIDESLTIYRSKYSRLVDDGSGVPYGTEFDKIRQLTLSDYFIGAALATQKNGDIYLFGLNGDAEKNENKMYLYKLNIKNIISGKKPFYEHVATKDMNIPGMSDSVSYFFLELDVIIIALSAIPGLQPVGAVVAALANSFGEPLLNSSFRWGKGLSITSKSSIEVYATDRNVLPLSLTGISKKDFSVVTWKDPWDWSNQGTPSDISITDSMGAITVRGDSPYVFVKGDDGTLRLNWWTGTEWLWSNQGKPPRISITDSMGAITVRGDSPYVFVKGDDGTLRLNWWTGTEWLWSNQGKPPDTSITDSMGAITVRGDSPYVFVKGGDGTLRLNWWTGTEWLWSNQGTPPRISITDSMGAITVRGDSPYVFVKGDDGTLRLNWWTGTEWLWSNQGKPPDTSITDSMGAITVRGDSPYVFVKGGDGTLRLNWWTGTEWLWSNQGKPSRISISDFMGAITVDGDRPYVFVKGDDGNLWLHWWSGSAWNWSNQGTPSGISISDFMGAITVDGDRPYVFVKGDDGNLCVRWCSG